MMESINRRALVSEIVDHVLLETGELGHPLAEPIKEIILQKVLVPDREWEKMQREEPGKIDVARLSATLDYYLKYALERFPLDQTDGHDLDKILTTVRQNPKAPEMFLYPCSEVFRWFKEKFA